MIDWGRVDQLREEVGADAFGEVVEIFLEEVQEVVNRLEAAPDPDQLADDLHFLKGSALSLGFARFAALCQEGEAQAKARGAASVDLAPLLACFTASRAEFLDGLPGRAAA